MNVTAHERTLTLPNAHIQSQVLITGAITLHACCVTLLLLFLQHRATLRKRALLIHFVRFPMQNRDVALEIFRCGVEVEDACILGDDLLVHALKFCAEVFGDFQNASSIEAQMVLIDGLAIALVGHIKPKPVLHRGGGGKCVQGNSSTTRTPRGSR